MGLEFVSSSWLYYFAKLFMPCDQLIWQIDLNIETKDNFYTLQHIFNSPLNEKRQGGLRSNL